MLRIDCLLVNTEVADTVRKIIGYLGHKGIADGTDVSFRSMYKQLRKNGVEIDLETAAHIYANELPIHDARFTPIEDLKYDTGRWFQQVVRAITLQKPKTGEKEISELSPAQAVVKAYSNLFSNNVSGDATTKSILRTLEDIYKDAGKRMLGELPNDKSATKDTRTAAEIVQQALDNETIGYKNKKDGTINGLAKIHDEVRAKIKELTAHMEATGDQDKVDQWNAYAKSLEDASYTMLFNSKEAKNILHDSMEKAGFTKVNKKGETGIDWQKLTGNINSYSQLRENVIKALTSDGISKDVAERVADSMSKEFSDVRGKILEVADRERQKVSDTWNSATISGKKDITELIKDRFKKWDATNKLRQSIKPLQFSKNEAKFAIADAIKNNDLYSKEVNGKKSIDWQQVISKAPDQAAIEVAVKERLIAQGMTDVEAARAAQVIAKDYYPELKAELDQRAKTMLDTRQGMLDREASSKKGEFTRLAEMYDLGIFDGAHDKLLASVLGIEEQDRQAMDDVRQFAEQMSNLSKLMNGNDFLVPSMQREVAHQIQQIVARNIEDKTKMLKSMSNLNKIFQVENMSLVSGWRNIVENHLSGLQEYITTKANLRVKLGKELVGNKAELRKLMVDTWQNIAAGGNEFGLAPYQVGGTQLRVSDVYNLSRMKGADWSKPSTYVKAAASAVMTVPRAFLSGTDGMFKTGMYRLHFVNGMYDALINTGKYTHDDAVSFINDAMYGTGQLEKARIKAQELYAKSGINIVSKKNINITANELLHENLINGSEVTPDMIKEVQDAAFHMAGLGMGHESNNPISKFIQSSKMKTQREEIQAFNEGDYSTAASKRLWNTVFNSIILRFAASQANWAWLKIEQSGIGLISGMVHYQMGKRMSAKDLLKPENIRKQAEHYQKARQSAARGALGLAINTLFTGVAIPQLAQMLNPDEEDPVQALFDDMGDNYLAKRFFIKAASIWGLADYSYHKNSKAGAPVLATAADIIENLTGLGSKHSAAVQIAEIAKYAFSDNEKMADRGKIKAGEFLGNYIPSGPFFRPTRDVLQTVRYGVTGEQPMYNYPENFWQGLVRGGMIEAAAGLFPDKYLPEWAEGWGSDNNNEGN